MAVVIRLRRTGRKNLPCYRITVTDSRFPRDGRSLETLGLYDPLRRDAQSQLTLDQERTAHWLKNGAVASDIVQSLFKRLAVFPRKVDERRKRPGRKQKTATRARREAVHKARVDLKTQRFAARVAQKRAAAKAAKAAEPAS
ncbi:MAG: 30S ribosomal protein S16 [Planctomycetes bacterium]|nr:30S ribosomal protein S16 [Planctomycetota bacterium]